MPADPMKYFSERAKRSLNDAVGIAQQQESPYIDTEHLLLEDEVIIRVLKELNIDQKLLKSYLLDQISNTTPIEVTT